MCIGSALMLGTLCFICACYIFVSIASERVVQYDHANKSQHDDECVDYFMNLSDGCKR